MIQNPHKMTNVRKGVGEYFFLYNKKYKWSVSISDEILAPTYYLHYYPFEMTIEELSKIPQEEWDSYEYLSFSTKELKSQEAEESFQELYRMVKGKIYKVNEVLDDIIKDGEEEPL